MSLILSLKFMAGYNPPEATGPELAEHFKVSKSTSDNWVRRGVDLGLMTRHRPEAGAWKDQKGSVGRPPCSYTLTAAGLAAAKSGELPAPKEKARKPKAKAKTPAKAKAKVKTPAKAKAKTGKSSQPRAGAAGAKVEAASTSNVLDLLASGMTQTQVAKALNLSRHQVARIAKKAKAA